MLIKLRKNYKLVDRTKLTINSKQSGALVLFQAVATKIKVGALVLLGDKDGSLAKGDNFIKVKITVNNVKIDINARLTNVIDVDYVLV